MYIKKNKIKNGLTILCVLAILILFSEESRAQPSQKGLTPTFDQLALQLDNFEYQAFETTLDSITARQGDFNTEQHALFNFYRGRQHFLWMNLHGAFYYLNKAKVYATQLEDKTLFFKTAFMQINLLNQMKRNDPNKKELLKNYESAIEDLKLHEHPIVLPPSASKYYSLIKYYKYIIPNNDSCLHYAYLYKNNIEKKQTINTQLLYAHVILAQYTAKTEKKSNDYPLAYYNTIHQAINIAKSNKDSLALPLIYEEILKNFSNINQLDSVQYYLSKFDNYCNDINRQQLSAEIFYIQRNLGRLYAHLTLATKQKNETQIKNYTFKIYEATVNLLSRSSMRSTIVFEQLQDLETAEENRIKNIRARNYIIRISLLAALIILFIYYLRRKALYKLRQNKQYTENIKKQALVDTFSARLAGQEKERKKIAKELHDEIAANLAGIKHKIEVINKTTDREKQGILLSNSQAQLSFLYQKVRNLSHIMDMPEIGRHSFKEILESLFEEYKLMETFDLEYALLPENKLNDLPSSIKKHIFLLYQELLLNTYRHAQATQVNSHINILEEQHELQILFEDNGVGVSQEIIDKGFISLKDRIKLMNGKLEIYSSQDGGTKITMSIPLL